MQKPRCNSPPPKNWRTGRLMRQQAVYHGAEQPKWPCAMRHSKDAFKAGDRVVYRDKAGESKLGTVREASAKHAFLWVHKDGDADNWTVSFHCDQLTKAELWHPHHAPPD